MRIFYIIGDVFRGRIEPRPFVKSAIKGQAAAYLKRRHKSKRRPVGGAKVHYQHCAILRDAGFEAYPLAMGTFSGNAFGFDIEALFAKDVGFDLGRDDIVVSTEFDPYDGLQFNNCKRIMFAQNWINIQRRRKPEDQGKSYRDMGYDDVIACGKYIAESIELINHENVTVLTNGVDGNKFFPDATMRQPNRIMCLPRKNAGDLAAIKKFVLRKIPDAVFVDVDGVPESVIAEEYRKSDIFLSTGYPEGFGLPPLEAIFSGCAVVGFSGRGGREFLVHNKTALVAEDGDTITAARLLIDLLQDKNKKEMLRQNGQEIRENYSYEKMREAVVGYYKALI